MAVFTQTQLDNLRKAIATGSLEVGAGANRVRYRSFDEMREIESLMAEDLGQTPMSQASGTSRISVAAHSRE
jgi:hypothetical protein